MAFAAAEWSTAGRDSAGAAAFTFPTFLRAMRDCREKSDTIIVLLHMGKEHYALPSPELQASCRCLVEEGADVVICQHSHCSGAAEHYQGRFISYGQGNFLFDWPGQTRESWRRGYLVEIVLSANGGRDIRLVPYSQGNDQPGVRLLDARETERFHADMKAAESCIQDTAYVEAAWRDFCDGKRNLMFGLLRGHGRLRRGLDRYLDIAERSYSAKAVALLENVVRCQAQREVLQGVLAQRRRERWGEAAKPEEEDHARDC